jgi:NAD(P)-dependent dehydrogenase (short-subunit alcohol dehydrogenase family)
MTKTALILGAGANVGASVASAFAEQGYLVAAGRRNVSATPSQHKNITSLKIDLTDTKSIPGIFSHVTETLGVPNVVVWNAYSATHSGPADDPFTAPAETLDFDNHANIVGVYTALQEAIKGWKTLPADNTDPKVFIVTGNILPWLPDPRLAGLSTGKAGAAHLIHLATTAKAYADAGYRFYFASEVTQDGLPQYHGISGEAHAKKYLELVESREQLEWEVRFKPEV